MTGLSFVCRIEFPVNFDEATDSRSSSFCPSVSGCRGDNLANQWTALTLKELGNGLWANNCVRISQVVSELPQRRMMRERRVNEGSLTRLPPSDLPRRQTRGEEEEQTLECRGKKFAGTFVFIQPTKTKGSEHVMRNCKSIDLQMICTTRPPCLT